MVMVHGLRDHSGRYDVFAREMNAAGVVVHAMDLRGHGKSEGRRGYTPSFDDYLRDLERFLKLVEDKEAMPAAFLLGHSLGGTVATLYSLTRAPPLRGLILSAPLLQPGKISKVSMWLTQMMADAWPGLPVLKLDPRLLSRDPAVLAQIRADPLVYHRSAPARTAAAIMRALTQIDQHMEQIRVPLLLVHGGADRFAAIVGSERLADRAKARDVTLKVYPQLMHDLLREPEGPQVRADIRQWVEARLPPE
jgi:alpha-beta hydrolase superfamily lysophospholipase